MREDDKIQEFSLLGGPLHWLGCRLGLVRNKTNTFWFGLALGILAWGVLVLLGLVHGVSSRIFSLAVIGGHIRLLAIIPLFFLCETLAAPQMREFVREITNSGIVSETELPVLASDIRRVGRLKDSRLVEALLLLIAFVSPIIQSNSLVGKTGNWAWVFGQAGDRFTLVNLWYLGFCLPLFRFLILRWIWHLVLWYYFLLCVEKLKLNLSPIHSDGAGGLGYLEIVHEHFIPLAIAISTVFAASFAEDIYSKTIAFEALYLWIPMILLLNIVLFICPLLVFTPKLWNCRVTGWSEYMAMASRYVNAFDQKWIKDKKATGESQLGTSDIQSLADLTNSLNVVREMRWIPASRSLIIVIAVFSVLPLMPLFFLKYPLMDLTERLFQTFFGL